MSREDFPLRPGAARPGEAAKPPVRRFLDLSTAHLPQALRDAVPGDLRTAWGSAHVAVLDYYGFWLWVPDDPVEASDLGGDEPVPPEVLAIQLRARALECDYVLFDADGARDDDLPLFAEEG